jgi:peptidoglycan-associated lipoprotein
MTAIVSPRTFYMAAMLAFALAGGCSKSKPAPTITTGPAAPARPARAPAAAAQTATVTPIAADQRGSEALPSFASIRFDFDSAALSAAARDELDRVAAWMAKASGRVSVEGHTDERGTTEYNLALGQQRAQAIASYLMRLGVAAGRIETITWGEERPAADGQDESAWAQNRRGDLRPDR